MIAAGLEPPSRLLVHSHWTVDDEKMSKSKKNVVDPTKVAKKYTYEGLRYFLLREGVPHSDGSRIFDLTVFYCLCFNILPKIFFFCTDYSDVKATRIINAELVNTLGNLLSRVCAKAINRHQIVPSPNENGLSQLKKFECTEKLLEKLQNLREVCETHFDSYNFYLGIDEIVATLHMTNGMVQELQPWQLAKLPEAADELNAVLSLVFESLRINAILLQPVVPEMATRILDKINIDMNQRSWNDAELRFGCEQSERSLNGETSILMQRIN